MGDLGDGICPEIMRVQAVGDREDGKSELNVGIARSWRFWKEMLERSAGFSGQFHGQHAKSTNADYRYADADAALDLPIRCQKPSFLAVIS